jgi:hypothetical protein
MHQTSDKLHHLNLTGYGLWVYADTGQPVLARLEGVLFLQLFSTREKAEAALPLLRPAGPVKLKAVSDQGPFLGSVWGKVRVMVDPYIVDGKTRFIEVNPPGAF